jgi:MFS family permease
MALCGGGIGMMIPNTNMWVMQLAPPAIRGRAIGQLTTFWFLGQFLTPVVILPLVSRLSNAATFYVAAGLLLALSVIFFGIYFFTARR